MNGLSCAFNFNYQKVHVQCHYYMSQNILEDHSLITCKRPVQGSGILEKKENWATRGRERKGGRYDKYISLFAYFFHYYFDQLI